MPRPKPNTTLTPREQEIYRLIVEEALPQTEIAKRLGTSIETVKNQVHSVFRKTGACTVLELAVWHYSKPQ